MTYDVRESDFRFIPGLDSEIQDTLRSIRLAAGDPRPKLVDTTMLYAPRSGGVKRYLTAKRAWLAENRKGVSHSLVVPGAAYSNDGQGLVTLAATRLPFGDGYRWPSMPKRWASWLSSLKPSIIEAGDPYTPGQAAIEAGQRTGCPVVGFCHSDPAALAALHFGEWAKKPVEKRWAKLFKQFDKVVAPSAFIARRLEEAGVGEVFVRPLGVEVDTFHPDRRDRDWLVRKLGVKPSSRILVFAGRPAREKNIGVLVDAVQKLGDPYVLVLVGAGAGMPPEDRVICLDYEANPKTVARIVASADAFVHANDREPFGLIVLEAMACGRPVVGVNAGGVAETVDSGVGQLARSADPDDYAEAIEALFARDVEAVGAAARTRAVERFAWNRVFEDLCLLYGQLSGRPGFEGAADLDAIVH
ncbi:MAG: glycosyltransferase [Caulobacteraceae bacterium]|nr:glycosyltransferase [Caulobacteraceae bacterium]